MSLQLSVSAHKNLYGDVQQEAEIKALANLKKEITVQDRRKFELLIKSGATSNFPLYLLCKSNLLNS